MNPKLDKALRRLKELRRQLAVSENYKSGKYAELGVTVSTPCVELDGFTVSMRAAAVQLLGPRPPDANVCHRCSSPRCFAKDHLFYATPSEMVRDSKLRKGARTADPDQLRTMIEGVLRRIIRYGGSTPPGVSQID